MKTMPKKTRIPTGLGYAINAALFALFLAVIAALAENRVISYSNSKVLMLVAVNIILAVSLNVATGYLGQLPLGPRRFMAVGAYTSALFMPRCPPCRRSSCSPSGWSSGPGGGLFRPYNRHPRPRLKGDYLAIITWASPR
jgi:branched-chain amino acid transport system permease protein